MDHETDSPTSSYRNAQKDLKEPSKKVTATLSSRNYPDESITKNRQISKESSGIVGVACCHLIYSVSHSIYYCFERLMSESSMIAVGVTTRYGTTLERKRERECVRGDL